MLLTRSCVSDRIMELEAIAIEMIKSSESVSNRSQTSHKMPLRCNLVMKTHCILDAKEVFFLCEFFANQQDPILNNPH